MRDRLCPRILNPLWCRRSYGDRMASTFRGRGCMLRRSYLAATLGLSVCCGCTASASAQQTDRPEIFYEYARNKIGLLRYCRDRALLGQVTADRAAEAIELGLRRLAISDPLVKERGDRAEKVGEAGFWEEADGKQDLASVAGFFGTSPAGLCKELGGPAKIQPSPVAKQLAPKVTPHQARSNVNSLTATEPASPPAAATKTVVAPPLPARSPSAAPWPFGMKSPFEVNKWRYNRYEKPWVRR